MKLLLLLLAVVAAATAVSAASVGVDKKDSKSSDAAVDIAVHPDATDGSEEGYRRHGHNDGDDDHHGGDHHGGDHHGGDYYCCYNIKKELEKRMNEANTKIVLAFLDTKKSIKSNMDRVNKMEKRLEDQEDLDVEELQQEVGALVTVIGDVEDQVKDLKGVEKKHHEHLVNEIKRLEEQIGRDEGGIEKEIHNVTTSVQDLSEDVTATKSRLDDAGNEISVLNNKTENLDGRLRHIGEMTMRAFEDVAATISNVSSVAEAASAKGEANAAAIGALAERTTTAEGKIEMLFEKNNATANALGALTTDFNWAVARVDAVVKNQDAELDSLKNAHESLESVVNTLEAESGGNSSRISVNADAIAATQQLVSEHGDKIDKNANDISDTRGQLQQLVDSVEALRLNLQQHREDVVEQMKKLTAAIAS